MGVAFRVSAVRRLQPLRERAIQIALEEPANLPLPNVIAAQIAADLKAALEQFATIADDLK